ncbi:hypothetical protein Tco_0349295 [Tanacetum coccineum]
MVVGNVLSVARIGISDVGVSLHENRSAVDWFTQPEKDETESHTQFAGGNVTLVTRKEAWKIKVSEAKAQGKIGNGELCFPRDDVPNNYTGYGGREYSWQSNPYVSHPKLDVYRVETKAVVVTGGQYSSEVLKLNIALTEIGLIFLIIFKEYGMSPFACMRIEDNCELCFPRDDVPNNYTRYGGREYSWQANPFVSHPKPDVYQVETKGIWDVAFRLHENRSAIDSFGDGELRFPRDDVPNKYTGYGGKEYSWQANPCVSHPKLNVYRVETKGILSNTNLSTT